MMNFIKMLIVPLCLTMLLCSCNANDVSSQNSTPIPVPAPPAFSDDNFVTMRPANDVSPRILVNGEMVDEAIISDEYRPLLPVLRIAQACGYDIKVHTNLIVDSNDAAREYIYYFSRNKDSADINFNIDNDNVVLLNYGVGRDNFDVQDLYHGYGYIYFNDILYISVEHIKSILGVEVEVNVDTNEIYITSG